MSNIFDSIFSKDCFKSSKEEAAEALEVMCSAFNRHIDRYEVRKVSSDWIHPVDGIGNPILLSIYDDNVKQKFLNEYIESLQIKYLKEDVKKDLIHKKEQEILKAMMPNWPEDKKLCFMMYKTINGAGFPVSPRCDSDIDLAEWLSKNYFLDSFSFGAFDAWMEVIKLGSISSLIVNHNKL